MGEDAGKLRETSGPAGRPATSPAVVVNGQSPLRPNTSPACGGADSRALHVPRNVAIRSRFLMQRTSKGPRRVPLPLELVPVVRLVEHDTAGEARTARSSSFYPSTAWNNYRPGSVSPQSGVLGGEHQQVPQSNSAGCVGMPPGSIPVSTPIGAPSPMMTFATGSCNVPQAPLASFSNPGSIGMFGSFNNVSQAQMGSQMGYNPMQEFSNPLNGGQSPHGSASGSQPAVPIMNAQPAPLFASVPGAAASATTALGFLNQSNAPPVVPQVNNAFEMLGRPSTSPSKTIEVNKEETMMKALVAALSGDRKLLPGWNGNVETLHGWLRQLSLWELDNNLPKNRWGLKLLQSFSEGSAPRKIAETIDVSTLTSDSGYGAILSAILAKYAPFLEAAGPASIESFFYGCERSKQESFSTYIAAKEVALQELEANLGERLPTKIAGRILLRHAGLTDTQREAMAVKYNSMMTFEQAASALRPLDRPEALVTKVAKTYMATGNHEDPPDQPDGDDDEEYDDEELQPDDEYSGPESDGNGNLTYLLYDANDEFTEEETAYIFAYNSAYRDVRRELQARRKGRQFFKPRGSGVIKKGKNKGNKGQPKGKGHSASFRSDQGRGRGSRGTPEELMAKTRCFSCGQLGHMSRDCPQRSEGQASNFFVCQGSSGFQNRVYVNISESKEKKLAVFAGVQTQGHEAVVDTAAEEAVIGSTAMKRLREQLALHGLQPVQASGATVTCAGIGGSAKIVGVFDVPVGVASTNGLLRVTEITDEGSFKTPFLLPISYIELVGATIDTNREQFILRNGKSTPMKRVPSGHRTISVLDFFNNKWMVPEQLRNELNINDVNPFIIPKKQMRKNVTFEQRPGVAVWMKTDDRLQYMGTLKGRRTTLVDPKEIFNAQTLSTLKPSRVTVASFCDNPAALPFSVHDTWQQSQHRQFPFWSGDVFFEQFADVAPVAPHLHSAKVPVSAHVCGDVHFPDHVCGDVSNALSCEATNIAATASVSQAVQDLGSSKRSDVQPKRSAIQSKLSDVHGSHQPDVKHVHFGNAVDDVSNMSCHEVQSECHEVHNAAVQPADISSTHQSQDPQFADLSVRQPADATEDVAGSSGGMACVRRPGHGRVSNADSSQCPAEDLCGLAQNGATGIPHLPGDSTAVCGGLPGKQKSGHHCLHAQPGDTCKQEECQDREPCPQRHWAATSSIYSLQRMAVRAFQLCARRRDATPKRLRADVLVDMPWMRKPLAEVGMGEGRSGERQSGLSKFLYGSSQSRAEGDCGIKCNLSSKVAPSEVKTRLESSGDSRCGGAFKPDATISTVSSRGDRQVPNGNSADDSRTNHSTTEHSDDRRSTVGAADPLGSQGTPRKSKEPALRSDPSPGHESSKNSTWACSHRNPCAELKRGGGQSVGTSGLLHGATVNVSATKMQPKPKDQRATLGTVAKAAMLSYVVIWSCFAATDPRLYDLMGNPMPLEASAARKTENGINPFDFPLNDSLRELSRTDFEGTPKFLERGQRHFVVGALRSYLDDVGEVYSPPRVTKEAQKQGLKGQIALDLSTGWDFRRRDHRRQALQLIAKRRPAILLLSPPCTTFSPLRRLSNNKREAAQVQAEEDEGDLHMDFSAGLAEMQMRDGRGFILEQPAPATSWKRPKVKKLLDNDEVYTIRVDMCRYGLRAQCGPHQGKLVRKPTLLATNIPEMAAHAHKVCQKDHQHGQLIGGAAKHAAVYTPAFVKAVVNGVKEALGVKSPKQPPELQQAFLFGKTLGAQAQIFAVDCLEVDAEVNMAYGLFGLYPDLQEGQASTPAHGLLQPDGLRTAAGLERSNQPGSSTAILPLSMDVDAPEEEADEDMVVEARRQMRLVGEQPGVANALEKMEDFQKTANEGEFSLAPNLRREVHRVHRNLGHPGLEIFVRALQNAGVQDHIVAWTKRHFRCPICDARPRPKPSRPGHLMRALEFNTVVGVDLCFLDFKGHQFIILNMLCWGTNFQQASLCKDKSAEEVLNGLMTCWIQHYGPPVLLIMDRGKEFYNDKLQNTIGGLGVGLHYIDAQSPWQNSRTERAGGILKDKILATAQAAAATTEEIPMVLSEVVTCRNRYMDRFGFSPMQRVFGKNLRLPASLMSTDALNSELTDAAAGDPIHRAWQVRELASQEWLRRQDQGAVRRSIRAQSRTTDQAKIPIGSWVYVFRDSPSYKGWVGPGVTIAEDPSGKSTWISMRGRLWKASQEQLRLATPEEELGAELIVELSKEMLTKLQKPGHVVFQDVSQEGGPTDDYYDEVMRTLEVREEGDQPPGRPPESSSTSSTSSTTGQTSNSTASASLDLGNTEDGSNSAIVAGSELPSRRASALSEQVEGQEPMEVIHEEEAMDTSQIEPSVPINAVPPNSSFGPSTPVRTRPVPYSTAPRPRTTTSMRTRDEGILLDQPETPVISQDSITGPTPTLTNRSFTPAPSRAPFPFNSGTPSLPRPPGQSFYLEVVDFDECAEEAVHGDRTTFVGANWRIDRDRRQKILKPLREDGEMFSRQQAEASYSVKDRCMYVSKAKSSFGQVEFSKLGESEKNQFRASRKKELESLVATGAVVILSVEDSLKFAKETPEQIIDSKYVDRYKPIAVSRQKLDEYKVKALQQGHLKAIELETDATNPKSRLCAVGWQDPQIMEVERSSPTPLSTSLYACLQLAASRRWKTRVKDVKTAFLQSLPTTRSKPLACRLPRDETPAGLDPRQLLLLKTEIYGLVSGPSWRRRTLLKVATENLDYVVNCYDRCVLTLPAKDPQPNALSEGFIVIEVDDIAEAGSEEHMKRMRELEATLKFGKVEDLQTDQGTNYAGRFLRQLPDFSFESNMDEFIYTRLEPIVPQRKVLKKDASKVKLSETEKTQLRGLIASLNWVSREGRPDASSAASILASAFPEPTMEHIFEANDVVKHLKTFPIVLRIHAIPESRLRLLLIADSAFDTSGKEKSQHGWLLGFTDPTLNLGESAPVSLMQWRSKRLRRKASSSLLCESISMSAATGALERLDSFFQSICQSNFNPRRKQLTEDQYLESAGKATVIASDSEKFQDPHGVCVMDAKSLFDSLCSEQSQGEDDRSALEVAIIRESLSVCRSRPRWVPHNCNPADSMTKFAGGHHEPLLKLLKTSRFMIEDEDVVLSREKQCLHTTHFIGEKSQMVPVEMVSAQPLSKRPISSRIGSLPTAAEKEASRLELPVLTPELRTDLKQKLDSLVSVCRTDFKAHPRSTRFFLRELWDLCQLLKVPVSSRPYRRKLADGLYQFVTHIPNFLPADLAPSSAELAEDSFLTMTVMLALGSIPWEFRFNRVLYRLCNCSSAFGSHRCLLPTGGIRNSEFVAPSRPTRISDLRPEVANHSGPPPAEVAPSEAHSVASSTRSSVRGSFVDCPQRWIVAANSNLRAGSSRLSPAQRAQRAWLAGQWARATIDRRVATPNSTETIDLGNRFWVVLRCENCRVPRIFTSSGAFFTAIGQLEGSDTVTHAFPSETEAKIYLESAGFEVQEYN
eukprot:s1075_g5.t1